MEEDGTAASDEVECVDDDLEDRREWLGEGGADETGMMPYVPKRWFCHGQYGWVCINSQAEQTLAALATAWPRRRHCAPRVAARRPAGTWNPPRWWRIPVLAPKSG